MSDPSEPHPPAARIYPATGLYPRLDVLPEADWPARPTIPIADHIPKPPSGPYIESARLSADAFVRWCVACDTVLIPTGQSAFCSACKSDYDALIRQRRAAAGRADVAISKRHLSRLHELAQAVDHDLGVLTRAYNADKRNLAEQMHVVMRNTSRLLDYLNAHLDDPRAPEQRARFLAPSDTSDPPGRLRL